MTVTPGLVVVYLRVSTEDQRKHGYSLPAQREQCLRKARETIGHDDFRAVVFEDAAGGDILERPALEEMREFVRVNRPAYFVCMDPDRFSRELFIQMLVTKELEEIGTQLVFVQHEYRNTEEGRLFYQFRGAISQYEKAKILERTRRGLRQKLKRGLVANGAKPYGYHYDTERDTLAVNPSEAEWVQRIFEWAAEKVLPYQIVDRLNALGVPTRYRRLWRSSTIQAMLRNTTYIGKMICLRWNTAGYVQQRQLPKEKRTKTPKQRPRDEWVTIDVPALIDEGLFQRVQAARKHHKRTAKRTAGLLSGIVRCGLCGASVHYVADSSVKHVLRCHNRFPRRDALIKPTKCTLPNVRASIIEERVWQEVASWFAEPEGLLERLRRADNSADRETESQRLVPLLDALRRQLESKRREQAVVISEMAKGTLDSEVASRLLADIKRHIDNLLHQVRETEANVESVRAAISDRSRWETRLMGLRDELGADAERVARALENLTADKRQVWLRRNVKQVLLFPGRTCEVIPDL